MNKFQRKEAREVNKRIRSYEDIMDRLWFICQARTLGATSGKRFDLNRVKTHYFKKMRRQYRKEVKNEQIPEKRVKTHP